MDKNFSLGIENFSIIDDYSDAQLAIVELFVCHDGNNLHDMPISLESIERAKKTLINKFLVAGFDSKDFKGHEIDEQIVGFFPQSSKMGFVVKDGRTYLTAQAVMSKTYAKWAYDVFIKENDRAVSMEITILKSEMSEEDGREHILDFIFNGVTLLGKKHTPACEGANASIIKFSKENALEVYSKHFKKSGKANIEKAFLENMKAAENSRKEETDKMDKELENEMEKEVMEQKADTDETTYMDSLVGDECEAKEETEMCNAEAPEVTEELCNNEVMEATEEVEVKEEPENEATFEANESETEVEESEGQDEKDLKLETLSNEICELKAKIANYEAIEKNKAVEEILSEVIDVLDSEKVSDLRIESQNYSMDNLNEFANGVKALAFEAVKGKATKYAFNKMPMAEIQKPASKYTW